MIQLFHIPTHKIDTAKLGNLLHGDIVTEFENNFKKYVGAKHAVSFNSATSAIFLALLDEEVNMVTVPSIIPPVVVNSILNAGKRFKFSDETTWVGDSYTLHDFGDYKLIDSAQAVRKNQFQNEAKDNDLMIFSFYPTKPVSSCDGGIIVSNDRRKIEALRELSFNGMSSQKNNWERQIKSIGHKMYMNSIQAFIANENLKRLDAKKKKLQKVRDFYNEHLSERNKSEHLYRVFVSDIDDFIKKMKKAGIVCGVHYKALHKHHLYRNRAWYDGRTFAKSDIAENYVSLPYHEQLTRKEQMHVIKTACKIEEWYTE